MPRALSNRPSDATVIPLPTEDTTPPLTKMYLAISASSSSNRCQRWRDGERRQQVPDPDAGQLQDVQPNSKNQQAAHRGHLRDHRVRQQPTQKPGAQRERPLKD